MLGRWLVRDKTPVLRCQELVLRAPARSDFTQWHSVRLASRPFLKPFEPRWTEADLGRNIYLERIRRGAEASAKGTEYTFFIFVTDDGTQRLAGGLTLSNIRRRVAQQVNLGYWMSVNDAGKGIMTRAVATVLPFVFDDLGLHRVHAACLPTNMASRRVLEKNRFHEEGYADNYLQIDGAWRDHVLYGLSRERYETSHGSV